MFDLEGIADHQAASQFCLFPFEMSLLLCVSPPLPCSQARATWLTSCSFPLLSPQLVVFFFLFPSLLHIHPLCRTAPAVLCLASPCLRPPYCYFSPHYTLPQPQPGQAGSPAGGPDGVLASGPALGSLSLQDGSAALLWPIWPRPVLAPAGDYGPAGRRQSWR